MLKLNPNKSQFLSSWAGLFASFSTLFCCALPALLVSLGAGASLISLFTYFPFLITLSEHKEITWMLSGTLLLFNSIWLYIQRKAPCPLDPKLAKACTQARVWNIRILIFSWVLFGVGVGISFL